jgi:hypothetical protein
MVIQKITLKSVLFTLLIATILQAGPVSYHGALSTSGKWIMGGNTGQPAQLRGMSLYWSFQNDAAQFYNATTIAYLRNNWKSDVVRAAMGIEGDWGGGQVGYLSDPTANKNRVKTVVDAAIANDMYVIIDWHDHNAHNNQTQAVAFFREMAQTYGSNRHVIYEIWNEPLAVSWSNTIKPYANAVIAAIRQYDPDNLIVVGTPNWSQDVDVASGDKLTGTNIAYGFHFYAATHKQYYRDKLQTALNNNLPVFVTEWGTVNADGGGSVDDAESRAWMNMLDQNKISWANWSLNDINEGSAALDGSNGGANASGSNWITTTSGTWVRNELIAKQQNYSVNPSSSSTTPSSSSQSTGTNVLEGFNYQRIDMVAPGANANNLGFWYSYKDTYGSTITPGDSAGIANQFGDGTLSVAINLAAEVAASDQYPYAGVGFDFINNGNVPDVDKATVNLTSWSGITITYSASAAVIMEMAEARTADGAEWYCLLPATIGTSTMTCNWIDFQQPSWVVSNPTAQRPIPTGATTGFKFAYKTGSSSINFALSQLKMAGNGSGTFVADVAPPSSSSSGTTPSSSSGTLPSSSSQIQSSSSAIPVSSSSAYPVVSGLVEGFNYNRIDMVAPGATAANLGYWYNYIDGYGSTMSPNDSASMVNQFGDGILSVNINLAAEIAASSQYPYAGVGFDFINNGNIPDASKATVNLTSWQGVSVKYTASTAVILEMGEARTADGAEWFCLLPATFGTQTEQCLWSNFAQPSWVSGANVRPMPTAAVTGFKFAYKTGSSSTNFALDEIKMIGNGSGTFIADVAPPEDPVFTGAPADALAYGQFHGFAHGQLSYSLKQAGAYELRVSDIFGRTVTHINGHSEGGIHTVNLEMLNLNSGVYLISLRQGSQRISSRITIH